MASTKLDIKCLDAFALTHGARLITRKLSKASTKISWQCRQGHVFNLSWSAMQNRKHFCTVCKAKTSERKCKLILENHLNVSFKKIHIHHNPNDKRSYIEIDGFNKSLSLGFEYNGKQHYVFPNYYHKTRKDFQGQLDRDNRKMQYCATNHIELIVIPYTVSNLEQFIVTELKRLKYDIIKS